ncbi:class I SAM-dependent methyltransferase [Pectinatus frisingensis]|uniref:class I SAM-dependent methyltransferase n=1 Tax=Pectinatus frisingensis TaxID=865 RepID=UPI0018C63591|nr:class I SAM-dependent methyltransferase [Pectinatus frisingensis]
MITNQTKVIKQRYNRTARFYNFMDKMISKRLRRQIVELASGNVLEIGVGTGKNLSYYKNCVVIGIDFSSGMLAKAQKVVRQRQMPIKLLEMDAQNMMFPDNSFDTVLATCVFCSVPNPVKGLEEARRVCKPDGRIILLEHVRSENFFLGRLMDMLNPLSLHLIGSNINRKTVENVEKANIKILQVKNVKGNLVKLIIGTP